MTGNARIFAGAALAAGLVLGAGPVLAHAFGERYELPLPLGLYLGAAAAVVVVSFAVIGYFVREAPPLRDYPRLDLLAHPLGRRLAHPALVLTLQIASVLLFALTVAAGLLGNPDPFRNLAPVLVWIIFWVGMAFVSAFVGDLWAVVNPWRTLFAWAEAAWRRLRPGRELARGLPYPEALGMWPAVLLLAAFTWSELISPRPAAPGYIAVMALAYSILTWTGMTLFGRERWLERGEVFSVIFSILARFAPIEVRAARPEIGAERAFALRPFAVGLLREGPVSVSAAVLVLLYLVAVVFDGVLATPAWRAVEAWAVSPGNAGAAMAVRTLGLIGLWFVSAGTYWLACRVMAALAGWERGAFDLARGFVMTLVPIAIAYHLGHYLTYLLIQGQHVIPIASDPFGRGWDLFGTAGYRVDVGLVGARFAWYAAVIAIVAGHIVAVFLAHARALATFGPGRAARASQYPLTALMVAFTVASLTILAEPIVQRAPPAAAAAAAVAIPADAVLPEPGSGRFSPVGPGQAAATKLTYSVMASPFHDGSEMTAADLFYPFAVAYRWGARGAEAGAPFDPEIDRATALLRRNLKGLKFTGEDKTSKAIRFGDLAYGRDRLGVDVYVAAPGDDPGATALAPPWSPLPWHAIALMEEAVTRGFAAFSRAEAGRRGVGWLDPVRDEGLKRRLGSLVEQFERDGFVPEPLAGMVTAAEARARWKALAAFHAEHGHFLVTNGPYRIQSWDGDAAVLAVVRDPRYPLGIGSYDAYAIPRRAFVTGTEPGPDGIVLAVEVEAVETSGRNYRIVRQPLKSAAAGSGKRAIPEARFIAIGADGKAALAGRGRYREDGVIVLDLKGALAPGRYTVLAALYLNDNSVNAEIRRIAYEAR